MPLPLRFPPLLDHSHVIDSHPSLQIEPTGAFKPFEMKLFDDLDAFARLSPEDQLWMGLGGTINETTLHLKSTLGHTFSRPIPLTPNAPVKGDLNRALNHRDVIVGLENWLKELREMDLHI